MVRILTKDNVAELLNMADALEYVEEAYKQLTLQKLCQFTKKILKNIICPLSWQK